MRNDQHNLDQQKTTTGNVSIDEHVLVQLTTNPVRVARDSINVDPEANEANDGQQ